MHSSDFCVMWSLFAILCSVLLRLCCGLQQDTHNPVEHISLRNTVISHHHLKARVESNVTVIEGKRAWVEVSWSGFKKPSLDDWLGVMAPASADVRDSTPVKYRIAADSEEHLESGSGKLTFLLENHRTDLRIGFFYNGFKHPRLAGCTDTIRFKNHDIPSHGRLSLTGDNTEMLVQWTTASDRPGTVQWGTRPGQYDQTSASKTITYKRHEMCGGAAKHSGWLHPGHFHHALLTGLTPGQRYYYRFGSDDLGFSPEWSFRAAPEVGPDSEFRGFMIADMGQGEPDGAMEQSEMAPSLDTVHWMTRDMGKEEYSLVGHFGDISYARGHVSQWDRFHEQVEPLAASMPYMVAIGNHERDWPNSGDRFSAMTDSGGECGVPHERRFLMPSPELDAPWFEYSYGPVHFIHYSTEHHFHAGSPQHNWVKRALARVDRRRTPWLVFAGHRPMYIDSTNKMLPDGDLPVAAELQEAFEDLLVHHRVDVTLHGHHHSYQRTCPTFRGECAGVGSDGVPNAPLHLVIGNAGAGLCLNVNKEPPKIFESVKVWWGYTRMHATGTSLTLEAVSNRDGSVFDTVELRKPAGWGATWHDEAGGPELWQEGGDEHERYPEQGRPKWWWEQQGGQPAA